MRVSYELGETERAVLAALAMVGVSQVAKDVILRLTNLLLLSDYRFTKLFHAVLMRRFDWEYNSSYQPEIERAINVLESLRLVQKHQPAIIRRDNITRMRETLFAWRRATAQPEPVITEEIYQLGLTPEGQRVATAVLDGRVAQLRPPQELRRTVFVASAFGRPELEHLYTVEFAPACAALALTPVRVDLTEPPQTITDRILVGIREARVMIADLTFARPSVYFEIGMAHGLGIPLILTCRRDHEHSTNDAQRVHFDLAQYKISFWQMTSDGSFVWPEHMRPSDRLRLTEQRSRIS